MQIYFSYGAAATGCRHRADDQNLLKSWMKVSIKTQSRSRHPLARFKSLIFKGQDRPRSPVHVLNGELNQNPVKSLPKTARIRHEGGRGRQRRLVLQPMLA